MDETGSIGVAGLQSLARMGMRTLLRDVWNGRIDFFQSGEDLIQVSDHIDAFIITSDIMVANLDFFLPRKQKTLVITDGEISHSSPSLFHVIDMNTDEADIKAELVAFLKDATGDSSGRGELSAREIDVLRLIAAGKLNKEIADELCISVNTVITHRKNLSTKLGIKSASGLSLYAMMNGMI